MRRQHLFHAVFSLRETFPLQDRLCRGRGDASLRSHTHAHARTHAICSSLAGFTPSWRRYMHMSLFFLACRGGGPAAFRASSLAFLMSTATLGVWSLCTFACAQNYLLRTPPSSPLHSLSCPRTALCATFPWLRRRRVELFSPRFRELCSSIVDPTHARSS